MGRLTIQYTVEESDLEEEVIRLLKMAATKMGQLTYQHSELMSHKTLDEIDNTRQQLAAIDHHFNDAAAIIKGYINYRSNVGEVTPESMAKVDQMLRGDHGFTGETQDL
jgi:hypothetical protein